MQQNVSSNSMKSVTHAWLDACRPKTLPLACMAILVGSSLALASGHFSWSVLALALLTAALLQVLSNLANDYGDGMRGVDNLARLGPVRALQSGALNKQQLRGSLLLVTFLCVVSGLFLLQTARQNTASLLVFVLLGLLSIIAAITYTLGRKPYGYIGLGDISVWLFFGCLAVMGSAYLHGNSLQPALLLPASACGLLAVAVLNVNNMRDIDNDRSCGKYTLAVRLGLSAAQRYHQLLLIGALLLFFIYLYLFGASKWAHLAFALASIPACLHLHSINKASCSAQMAPLLPAMVACSVMINGWFMLCLLLPIFI